MLMTPSPCHKLSHLLGPPPPSSVTYFMDGPKERVTDISIERSTCIDRQMMRRPRVQVDNMHAQLHMYIVLLGCNSCGLRSFVSPSSCNFGFSEVKWDRFSKVFIFCRWLSSSLRMRLISAASNSHRSFGCEQESSTVKASMVG